MDDLGWVPWVLTALFGLTAAYLTLRGQAHTKSAHWLALASKEVESLRTEIKSEMGSVTSNVVSTRNEVTALIAAGKSETLLAVSNAKSDALLAAEKTDGRVQRVETAMNRVEEQVKDLNTQLNWAVDQIREAVTSASDMGRSAPEIPGPRFPQPRGPADVRDESESEKS